MNRSLSLTSFFLFPQRWRNITVAVPARSMVCFLTHPPHDLSFLESLDFTFFRVRTWGPISEIPQSEKNIYRTPSLRRLSLVQPQGDCLGPGASRQLGVPHRPDYRRKFKESVGSLVFTCDGLAAAMPTSHPLQIGNPNC